MTGLELMPFGRVPAGRVMTPLWGSSKGVSRPGLGFLKINKKTRKHTAKTFEEA